MKVNEFCNRTAEAPEELPLMGMFIARSHDAGKGKCGGMSCEKLPHISTLIHRFSQCLYNYV